MTQNRNTTCVTFPGQPLSFILPSVQQLSRPSWVAANLREPLSRLQDNSFFPPFLKPVACLCSYSGRLIIPYLCCHSLLCTHSAPQQVLMHSCWGKSWAAPLPQKLQLFRWKLAG